MTNHNLTVAQRELLLSQASAWRARCEDPGDLAVMLALRFQLEGESIDASAALESICAARRSIGRVKAKRGLPARVGSVGRRRG